MEAEDANFSLFNYVNEVNAEVEKLEEQIAEIKVQTELPRSCDALCHYSWQHTTASPGITCQCCYQHCCQHIRYVLPVVLPAST